MQKKRKKKHTNSKETMEQETKEEVSSIMNTSEATWREKDWVRFDGEMIE